jgi:hypothetical protein
MNNIFINAKANVSTAQHIKRYIYKKFINNLLVKLKSAKTISEIHTITLLK